MKIHFIKFTKPKSLSEFFNQYTAFTSLLVISTLIWFAYETYCYHLNNKRSEIELAINKAETSLAGTFDYAESVVNYINKQITISDSSNEEINRILNSFKKENYDNDSIKDVLSVSMFSWVNRYKLLTVSSEDGILTHPINMAKRDYLQNTRDNPWKIYIGEPVKGAVSKQYVMPAGVGAKNKAGKYIGTTVLGFNIKNLTIKIGRSVSFQGMCFAILDQNNRIILKSEESFLLDERIIKTSSSSSTNDINIISKFSFLHPNHYFLIIKTIDKYPYKIVAGYNNKQLSKEILLKLIPYLLAFTLIGIFFIFISLFLKKSAIRPFIKLSKVAELISQNKADKIHELLPKTNVKEIQNLTTQLELIQEYKIDLINAKSSQERFFANMSHELRTPLNGILNFTCMIKQEAFGEINDDYKEMLEDIYSSGQHLLNLVNDILDFAKMDVGKMNLHEEEFSIVSELQQSIKMVNEEAKNNGVLIQSNIEHGLKGFFGDRRFFKQISLNLLSNAIKFTNSGDQINISLRTDGEHLVFEVKDSGIGIKPQDMEKVVKDFGQVGDGYKRGERQGTGLGLVITKKMAELHGGELKIESVYGKGTTVKILFPSARVVMTDLGLTSQKQNLCSKNF